VTVTCPKCGKKGYIEKKKIRGREYIYIRHIEGRNIHYCFIGSPTKVTEKAKLIEFLLKLSQ
jgi:hypothetical protein